MKNPSGPSLIGMGLMLFPPEFVLYLEIVLLLLSLLVVDSQEFVEDGSLTYRTWIEQEFHFLF
jgi:hypothetical protein